jgi:hypothetical protein
MPLIHWIMQNLQPVKYGINIDGVALVKKLVEITASGGASLSGTNENIIFTFKNGISISGISSDKVEFNLDSSGTVEISGDAVIELNYVLKQVIPYSLGDTAYTIDGNKYLILGYFWDLDQTLKYEVQINGSNDTTMFVDSSLLYKDLSFYYSNELYIAERNIKNLSS